MELRRVNFDIDSRRLQQFHNSDLMETIETGKLIFVMFWSNTNTVSVHSFELWSRVSEKLSENIDSSSFILGSVACHEESEVCKAFGVDIKHSTSISVYKNSKLFASLIYVGDEEFYLNWINM